MKHHQIKTKFDYGDQCKILHAHIINCSDRAEHEVEEAICFVDKVPSQAMQTWSVYTECVHGLVCRFTTKN